MGEGWNRILNQLSLLALKRIIHLQKSVIHACKAHRFIFHLHFPFSLPFFLSLSYLKRPLDKLNEGEWMSRCIVNVLVVLRFEAVPLYVYKFYLRHGRNCLGYRRCVAKISNAAFIWSKIQKKEVVLLTCFLFEYILKCNWIHSWIIIYIYIYIYIYSICIYIYIYTILLKVLGRPLLMNRFDYFSNFYEYKS